MFYEKAIVPIEVFRVYGPSGRITRAEVSMGACVFMVGDSDAVFNDPQSLRRTAVGLHVYKDDVDALLARAVADGAVALGPVQDRVYGDRMGMLERPVWTSGCF